MTSGEKQIIDRGLKVADSMVFHEDKIWSRYSNDKVDIGEELTCVIRVLHKQLPLQRKMTALSIGSSNEPQFRILETAFRGGLYLLDIERGALDIITERITRQLTDHVQTIQGDYNQLFLNARKTEQFVKKSLNGTKMNLITMHHSLYYSEAIKWHTLFSNLYRHVLASRSAMHAVLMAPRSINEYSTSWLYEHFAGKYFGHHNNQDLNVFRKEIEKTPLYKKAEVQFKRSNVYFMTEDFEQFMAVIWMVLLYPSVHPYSYKQREEITEFVYKKFWKKKKPLVQVQDHLVIYKGLSPRFATA